MSPERFLRRFLFLIALAWSIPPVFGLGLLIYIGMFMPAQMLTILSKPLEPAFILLSMGFALWYFRRFAQPICAFLRDRQHGNTEAAVRRIRRFPFDFWLVFLVYLIVAPTTVIDSAQLYAGFQPQALDWFRIHLVALIVSIIVGLPIFFLALDLFGQSLSGIALEKPLVTIKLKVFLIGALVPLLVDTMLVLYYWTTTGYFTLQTFGVWLLLELLAVAGSLIFVRSFGQSLRPLQEVIATRTAFADIDLSRLASQSTDELGVLAEDFRALLDDLHMHNEMLEINNRILRFMGSSASMDEVVSMIIDTCQRTVGGDSIFLILHDAGSNELVGVAQTGAPYNPAGYFRLSLDKTSMAAMIFNEGETTAISDCSDDPRVSPEMIARFAVRSALGTPLRAEGKLIGVLMSVGRHAPHDYSDREIILMESFAREAALAVHSRMLQQRSARAEQRYQRLNQLAPDAIFQIDEDLRVREVNAAAAKLLGARHEDLQGRNLAEFVVGDLGLLQRLAAGAEDGACHFEASVLRADGVRVPVEIHANRPMPDEPLIQAFVRDITVREEVLSALQQSEAWFRSIFENVNICVASTDASGRLTRFNEAFRAMLSYDAEELGRMNFADFTHPDDLKQEEVIFNEILAGKRDRYHMTKRYLTGDGRIIWVDLSTAVIRNAQGEAENFVAVIQDITERKMAEEELHISATAFESQESLMITDSNGVIMRVNKAFTEITGYSAEEVVGQTPRLFKSGRHNEDFYREMWETLLRTGKWQGEVWDRRKNGEIYPKWLTITAVKGSDGKVTHFVGSHIDITERKAAEEEIQYLAFYDPLTRLPNRRLLLDRLNQALVFTARSGRAGALLFIDLDHFKNLNDTLGHDIGDMLLQQVTQRLESCIREGDTVARLGGDEFVVMLLNLSTDALEAAAQTEAIGEKILVALGQSYPLATHAYHCTASIGVTLFDNNQKSTDELMKQADIAMYQAKKAGRNALRFFDRQMQESISARVSLENELHNALEFQQLHLHYQIQVDSSYRPLGAEALIRWIHPQRGLVSPAQFIPLAEESGLILAIGIWVLETVCRRLKAWEQDPLMRDLVLAVNVSAKQFRQEDFVAQLRALVRRHAINPMRLKLELTEGMLLENIEETIAIMNALNEIGVQFSLDDFGTGYSSLQYLKRLPLDQLKIDQLFVRDIAFDSSDIAIVRTIVAIAQSLGMEVIAEGVETEQQRQLLLKNGCSNFQGYLFGNPVPIEQFEAMIRQG